MKKRESKLKFSADEMSGIVDSAAASGSKRTDDNAGKDSADAVVDVTDRGIRATESAYRSYSQTRRTQSSSQRISNRQTQRAPSGHSSSTGSKLQQKRAIKKDYAAAKSGKGTARTAKNTQHTIKTARKKAKQAERGAVFIIRNRKAIIVLGLLAVMMLFLFGVFSSCSVLFLGGTAAFSGTTYPASDENILGAEELYCNMELGLQSRIDYYASNTNYDEYHYNIGTIGHYPHLLISAISALHPEGWDLESASGTISSHI